MEIKYKIISVDPSQHSIIVRYYSDLISEDSLATSFNGDGSIARDENGSPLRCQTDYNINVWQTTSTPTIEDIKNIANLSAPFDWFRLKHAILDPNVNTSLSAAYSMLNQEFVAQEPQKTIDDDVEKEIQQIIDSLILDSSTTNT